jgi:CMP-N-acetylneuraminic acid synthetase
MPLLAWSVQAAQQAGIFARVVVSSDDCEIIDLARASGAEIDVRPPTLAMDSAKNVEVLKEYLERDDHQNDYDAVCLLPPTAPLRSAADIKGAYTLWRQAPDEFVVGVSRYDWPPEYAAELDATGGLHLRNPEAYALAIRGETASTSVHPNGSIYLGSTRRFLQERTFLAQPLRGFLMPPERSLSIDYPHQLVCAEALLADADGHAR